MNPLYRALVGLLGTVVILGAVYFAGDHNATQRANYKAEQVLTQTLRKQEEERADAQRAMADISKQWQTYTAEREARSNAVLSSLRDSGIRLQVQLADAKRDSVTNSGRPLANGYAELHENTSRFLIGEAQRCDAQVSALQQTIRRMQGGK